MGEADAIAVVAVCLAAVALLVSMLLLARLARLTRSLDWLTGSDERGAFARQQAAFDILRRDVNATRNDLVAARADLSDALRHVAIVRYDAFADQGGRLSFSAALLDDAGDGLVLTSINARSETRSYAKGVKAGGSEHALSPEEQQAIEFATRTSPPTSTAKAVARKGRLHRT